MWVGLSEHRSLGLRLKNWPGEVQQDCIAQGPPAGFRNPVSICSHLKGGETFGYKLLFVCPSYLLAGEIYSYSKWQSPQDLPLLC